VAADGARRPQEPVLDWAALDEAESLLKEWTLEAAPLGLLLPVASQLPTPTQIACQHGIHALFPQ